MQFSPTPVITAVTTALALCLPAAASAADPAQPVEIGLKAGITSPTDFGAESAVLSSDGKYGWLLGQKLVKFDLTTMTQSGASIDVSGRVLLKSPDGTTLYAVSSEGLITKVNAATGSIISSATPSGLSSVKTAAISPDGTTLYVGTLTAAVYKIRTSDLSVVAHVATVLSGELELRGGWVSPDGQYFWAASNNYIQHTGSKIFKVRTSDLATVATIDTGDFEVTASAASADGSTIYFVNARGDAAPVASRVWKVNTATATLVGSPLTLTLPTFRVQSLVLPASGDYLYAISGNYPFPNDNIFPRTRIARIRTSNFALAGPDTALPDADKGTAAFASATGKYLYIASGASSGRGSGVTKVQLTGHTFSVAPSTYSYATTTVTSTTKVTVSGAGKVTFSFGQGSVPDAGSVRTLCTVSKTVTKAGVYSFTCKMPVAIRNATKFGSVLGSVRVTFTRSGSAAVQQHRLDLVPRRS